MPHSLAATDHMILASIAALRAAGVELTATTTMLVTAIAVWATSLSQIAALRRRLTEAVPPGPRAYDFRGRGLRPRCR